jgi:hypothetical protein
LPADVDDDQNSLKVIRMGDESDGSALEQELNMMRVYDEFDDCRHLVDEVFDHARRNRVRTKWVETALEMAYADYALQKGGMGGGPDYGDRLRGMKVEAIGKARAYVTEWVQDRKTR